MCPRRWLLFGLILCLAAVQPSLAHGGGTPQLVDQDVGPFRLYVWSKPEPIRVGDAHLTIGVFEPGIQGQADVAVLNAVVRVDVRRVDGPVEPWSGVATREESANKLYYELDFALPAEGVWRATVAVDGSDGSGQAGFDFEVLPRSFNWTWIGGGAVVLLAMAWWLWGFRPERRG